MKPLWSVPDGAGGRFLAGLLALTLFCGQTRGPVIVTRPEVWIMPATDAPLAIRIESSQPISPQLKLLVRGLSPAVKLSEGRMFGPGVWVLSLSALPRLSVRAPAEISRNDLSLALVTLEGRLIAEAKLTLFVAPPTLKGDQEPVAAFSPKGMTEEERTAAIKLLDKGDENIRAGNVAVAQQFYQRAADRGLAEAAMALAATYDPAELARMKAIGVQPNPALARMWYEKARELGARGADARLGRLP
jgi:hypothetical protein